MPLNKSKLPVLFLVYKRPDKTALSFGAIREARPEKLYVAADAPGSEEEEALCRKTRDIATNVDWDCEVYTLFRDSHMGLRWGVSSAIDWFFQHEEAGIILEDDCVARPSFFQFSEELLHRYSEVPKIMAVAGHNVQNRSRTEDSYYFSKYLQLGGWAGWSSSWKHFDVEMSSWPNQGRDIIERNFKSGSTRDYWYKQFEQVYNGNLDSWGNIWQYAILKNRGVVAVPDCNLVSDIGFGPSATHTKDGRTIRSVRESSDMVFPLRHPENISVHSRADQYAQTHHYQRPLHERLLHRLKRMLGLVPQPDGSGGGARG